MKLAEWARKQGIDYKTAHAWFKAGKMPVKTYQTETGTILVDENIVFDENDIKECLLKILKAVEEINEKMK